MKNLLILPIVIICAYLLYVLQFYGAFNYGELKEADNQDTGVGKSIETDPIDLLIETDPIDLLPH